jgi:hypothetical protein
LGVGKPPTPTATYPTAGVGASARQQNEPGLVVAMDAATEVARRASTTSFTDAKVRGLSTSTFDLTDNLADGDEREIETDQVEALMKRMDIGSGPRLVSACVFPRPPNQSTLPALTLGLA